MDLQFTVMIHVGRPVSEVFEAVADPQQLSSYFTTGIERTVGSRNNGHLGFP